MLSSSLFINGVMFDWKNAKYEINAAAVKDFKVFVVFFVFSKRAAVSIKQYLFRII